MKQIISMGGGGFSMEPDNPLLDQYVLKQVNKKSPKICFIGTASGDSESYIERFYNSFKNYRCEATHLSLFKGKDKNIRDFLLSQDIIYVGGGNTRNLLVLWKEWDLDKYLKEAYENNILLCGVSAGAICWFEQGLTDSVPNELNPINCLGFLNGSCCPHFDGEEKRKPEFKKFINNGQLKSGYGVDDSCALHFVDNNLHKIVSSVSTAKAYYIDKNDEKVLDTFYLG
jgi:dipeptidase E